MIGLIVISLALAMASDAPAPVCVLRVGSTCVFWSGSVECEITAAGLGNIHKDPKYVECNIEGVEPHSISGLVYCGNPGANKHPAPGIQPGEFDGTFTGLQQIRKGDFDDNGISTTTAYAYLDESQLQTLNKYCPNPQWTAFNFVPCAFTTSVDLVDEDLNLIDTATFECVLPDCDTLGWDKKEQIPERRQYQCNRLD